MTTTVCYIRFSAAFRRLCFPLLSSLTAFNVWICWAKNSWVPSLFVSGDTISSTHLILRIFMISSVLSSPDF